jgi:hypothetical protein
MHDHLCHGIRELIFQTNFHTDNLVTPKVFIALTEDIIHVKPLAVELALHQPDNLIVLKLVVNAHFLQQVQAMALDPVLYHWVAFHFLS